MNCSRRTNEKRLKGIVEGKGGAYPKEVEEKINKALDKQEKRLDELNNALKRTTVENTELSSDAKARKELEEKRCSELYLRIGSEKMSAEDKQVLIDAHPKEVKEMISNEGPSGGYFIRPMLWNKIIEKIRETSPMRSLATIQPITTNALDILLDLNRVSTYWEGESATEAGPQADAALGKMRIDTHAIYSNPQATMTMLQDSAIDLENWIYKKLSQAFGLDSETAFFEGDGVGMPKGILTELDRIAQVKSGVDGKLTADSTVECQNELLEHFQTGSVWLAKRKSATQLRLLKDAENRYQLSFTGDLTSGRPFSLLGAPIQYANDMPKIKAGAVPLLYGNFSEAYLILDRLGMSVMMNPFKITQRVIYQASMRVGGALVNPQAVGRA